MTNLTNLARDMFWAPEPVSITESAAVSLANDMTCATGNVGYTNHGSFQFRKTASLGAGDFWLIGVPLQLDVSDNLPFRFKGISSEEGTLWGVGFIDTIAASVTCEDIRWFGSGKTVDEVVCVREPSGTPNTYAVFFGAVPGGSSKVIMAGSCQRLLGRPDSYATAVA
jgi:hypothetical protein